VLVGNFKVGGGVPGVALNGEDAYVTGTFEVDGASQFDGAATIGDGGDTVAINSSDWAINATGVATGLGAVTMDGALTASAGATFSGANKDVTLSADSTGGNKMAVNQFIGVPRITLAGLGQIANGTTNTVITDIGDSETPATDWTAINANTTMSNNTDFFRQGTASLKMAVLATAVAGDGCTNALASGDQNWTDDEGFGFWFYTTKALEAGDLTLRIADATAGGGYTALDVPAATANSWQWLEINVSSANNLKDVITDLSFNLSAAGQAKAVAGAFDVYFDFIVKWDVADEEALPQDIQTDGVLTVMSMTITDANAASANLTEYTHYFTNYQTSTDAIVPITDLSGTGIAYVALIAY
jgi:hypothetical protein